jgi:phosphoribosylaminoimidazolecarboxamide formyltransferase/IMP cyclohydrolase
MSRGRIAVGVSGTGSNLSELLRRQAAGALGGSVELVFADRQCAALESAASAPYGITTLLLPDLGSSEPQRRAGAERELAEALATHRIDLVVLAGFMRLLGPAITGPWAGRILNTHPSLLPAFPGAHAVPDALAHGARMTGATVHLVDDTLDGGPIVLQEAVPIAPDDTHESLHARIKAVERRLLPRAVVLALAGALTLEPGGRRVAIDPLLAEAVRPERRRALLSVSDKSGLVELARHLLAVGFEIVSTGGTARALRDAGIEPVDVAAVTGQPEILDGRVKTLHPRIHAGILADRRRAEHRTALADAAIEPFELVVVNLYPFEEAAGRPGIAVDELIEEIDIGGPALVRAAAKNHRGGVTVVTSPARYAEVVAALGPGRAVPDALRAELAVEAFRHTARYDARIADELARRPDTGAEEPSGFPRQLLLSLERSSLLRYGENPHQAAALYLRPGADPRSGPFAAGAAPIQGKALSYNNLLDAAAAAALARDLRGPAAVIVKHGNPCGAAEAGDLVTAWDLALAGDPVSAFGGVVGVRGRVDGALAARLGSMFLEVIVAEGFDQEAIRRLAQRPDLRLLADPGIGTEAVPAIEMRSAGGAILATDADVSRDERRTWRVVTRRAPSASELEDLDFCWRVVRHVRSNAIVLGHDRAVVGVGAGQMSRVDSVRLAVDKAGPERARGSACASDAFFPFADGVEALVAAGVTAIVQPGGSRRDAEVVAAADRAGATMLLTGVRHFRH